MRDELKTRVGSISRNLVSFPFLAARFFKRRRCEVDGADQIKVHFDRLGWKVGRGGPVDQQLLGTPVCVCFLTAAANQSS